MSGHSLQGKASFVSRSQTDRPPIDYAILGEPHGYAVDALTIIAAMRGLQFEFVNGYRQEEFKSLFRTGTIDALQRVRKGEVIAALDTTASLQYTAKNHFINNLLLHENRATSRVALH